MWLLLVGLVVLVLLRPPLYLLLLLPLIEPLLRELLRLPNT